jgi:hypothetical protein
MVVGLAQNGGSVDMLGPVEHRIVIIDLHCGESVGQRAPDPSFHVTLPDGMQIKLVDDKAIWRRAYDSTEWWSNTLPHDAQHASSDTNEPPVFFPVSFEMVIRHPTRPTWAGLAFGYVYLFSLEN